MMILPMRIAELEAVGWTRTGDGNRCACGAWVSWFLNPQRQALALSALDDGRMVPHRSVCAARAHVGQKRAARRPRQAALFAGSRARAAAASESSPDPRTHFSGAAYSAKRDGARLSTQIERVYSLMADGRWRTLAEAVSELEALYVPVKFPPVSIQSQFRNLKKPPRCHVVEMRRRAGTSGLIHEWRLVLHASQAASPRANFHHEEDEGYESNIAAVDGEGAGARP